MGDYGTKDYYKKPGPRLLDSAGIGPLSDVVKYIRGIGVGPEESARPFPESEEAIAAEARPVGGLLPRMPGTVPGYAGSPAGEQYQGLYAKGAEPEKPTQQKRTARDVAMSIPDATFDELMAKNPHLLARDKDGNRVILEPKDEYEKMTDKEFKKAVGDPYAPGPKGIGYVETTDPKTGKRRMERVYNQPGGIGGDEIDLSNLNAKEITALAHLKTAMRAGNMENIEAKKLQFEIDKYAKSNDMKDPLNFMKLAVSIAPKRKVSTPQEDGTTITTEEPDANAGVRMLENMGYKPPAGLKSQPKPAAMPIPKVGDVVKGYKFKGGNPADKKSWEKV